MCRHRFCIRNWLRFYKLMIPALVFINPRIYFLLHQQRAMMWLQQNFLILNEIRLLFCCKLYKPQRVQIAINCGQSKAVEFIAFHVMRCSSYSLGDFNKFPAWLFLRIKCQHNNRWATCTKWNGFIVVENRRTTD